MVNKASRVLLALFLAACGGSSGGPAGTAGGGGADGEGTAGGGAAVAGLADGRLPATARPRRYGLTLALDPSQERFSGLVEIDVELTAPTQLIYLHAQGMEGPGQASNDGDAERQPPEVMIRETGRAPIDATWRVVDEERGLVALDAGRRLRAPGIVRVRIQFARAFAPGTNGLFRVNHGGDDYIYSQFEPLAARKAFPCFDEPGFKTPFDITLVVPEGQTAVTNTLEIDAGELSGGMRRQHFATTESLPTYLLAFAVGPFDVVEGPELAANDHRSRPVPFRGIAPRGEGELLAHAIEHTPRIVESFENYFAIGYPYDKLDVIAIPGFGGAMENAGLITFRDSLLLLGDDPPESQRRAYAFVMAHELAHQWFGNLVTMAWWDDLWLNEGFASWAETAAIEATFPELQPEVDEMRTTVYAMNADSLASARQIRQPIEDDHDIHNAFDPITYSKGQGVIAMMENWLTPEVFQRGVSTYLRENAESNATASELLDALSAAAERDVRAPFESFLNQPGVPLVEATLSCEGEAPSLSLRQSRYLPRGSRAAAEATWQIPVCARWGTRGSRETQTACTLLTETEGTLPLEGATSCPSWVFPNADGKGYYRWTLDGEAMSNLQRRGRDALSVRELLSYADSIEASFHAGRMDYRDAMQAIAPLSRRPERALAAAPMSLISFGVQYLASDGARDDAQDYAARLYRAHLNRLGWGRRRGEDGDSQLLRADVVRMLALVAEDGPVRREANSRGRDYVGWGGDQRLHTNVVPADIASTVIAVAAQNANRTVFDHMLATFRRTRDAEVRAALLSGISQADDEAYRTRVLELSVDRGLRLNETFTPLRSQMADRDGRDAAWAWIQENYDDLIERLGPGRGGYLPWLASSFCDAGKAAEVRAFFAPRVANTEGGPRNLEGAIERIELCAAQVGAQRGNADEFFSR